MSAHRALAQAQPATVQAQLPPSGSQMPLGQLLGCVTPSGAGLLTVPGTLHPVPSRSRLRLGGTPRPIGAWSQFGRLDLHRPPARGGWADCPPKFPRPELLRVAGRVEREIATKSADVHTYYTHVCIPNPYSATPYPPPAAARAWLLTTP